MSPRESRHLRLRRALEERLGSAAAERAFPVAEWQIVEHDPVPLEAGALESVFAVANGYLGVRGAPDEGTPAHDPGVTLNGFHETWPIVYPEDAYGLARTGQTIIAAPDGSVLRLEVDDEPLHLAASRILRFERVLDMQLGVLVREVEWRTARGHRVLVRSRRLASLEDRHLLAIDHEVTAPDAPLRVVVSSEIVTPAPSHSSEDPRRGAGFTERVLLPVAARAEGTRAILELETRSSGLRLACGMDHLVDVAGPAETECTADADAAALTVRADLAAGASLRVSKFVAYHWAEQSAPGDPAARTERTLDRAVAAGYDNAEFDHRAHVEAFWSRSDVEIEGAPAIQQAVRFNLFQLMQATARAEGLGVPAKGVTGRGYEGHYFWDTEVYVVPFLAHTNPVWALQTLEHRCRMLPAARRRAAEVGHDGALFPWRTINGAEASAWYAAGTAQYHINADVAHALRHHAAVTGDESLLRGQGAEVLIETARLWIDLGYFSAADGSFRINGVTGPDEYTTVVDNNAYTNLMARQNLDGAVEVAERLRACDPAAHARLVAATGLTGAEIDTWRRAAERMHVPRHAGLGIVLQDEHFLDREPWDFEATPLENYPLLLHYHPLELYRHQVIKQTDVVLATYLAEHEFTTDEIRRTFDYYDPLTTGDSTLSASIQSVIASQIDRPDAALDYFLDACAVDLLDAHRNTADGIHIASCGGTWLALVAGFGGLRDFDGDVRFRPRLPEDWDRLRFRVQVRGQVVEVDMTADATTYRLMAGDTVVVSHEGIALRLEPGVAVSCPVEARASGDLPLAA